MPTLSYTMAVRAATKRLAREKGIPRSRTIDLVDRNLVLRATAELAATPRVARGRNWQTLTGAGYRRCVDDVVDLLTTDSPVELIGGPHA